MKKLWGGCCERCGGEVIRKVKSQWMLKITEYAQRLLDDLSEVNYLDKIKSTQTNWIDVLQVRRLILNLLPEIF